MNKSRIRI